MGQAIARAFACEGYELALISRNPSNMEPYKQQVARAGQQASLFQADVTDKIIAKIGVPDIVIYNVATMTMEKPSELTGQALFDTLPLNLFGALHTTAAVLPAMRKRGPIAAGTDYDPDLIASLYLNLASQQPPDWNWEVIHKEL